MIGAIITYITKKLLATLAMSFAIVFLIGIIFFVCLFVCLELECDKPSNYSFNKKKPTEFFLIDKEIALYDGAFRPSVSEDFAVSNPPKDTALLKKMVEEYNLRTIPIDTLKKYKQYERVFYRETRCLTRDYKKGEPYPEKIKGCGDIGNDLGQQTRDYDFIMEIEYTRFDALDRWGDYQYRFGYGIVPYGTFPNGNEYREIRIKDIDSFYAEQMKGMGGF